VRQAFQRLLTAYGIAAVGVYFASLFAVLLGAWAAIGAGWKPTGALANVGALTAAYLFTKLTQPVRIAATVILAPLAAKGWERVTGRRPGAILPPAPPNADEPRA
jgi:hypothetical protein